MSAAGESRAETVRVVSIGAIARRALAQNGGIARPLEGADRSPFFFSGDDIVWISAGIAAMHPRVALTQWTPPQGAALRLDVTAAQMWRAPALPKLDAARRTVMRVRLDSLRARLCAVEKPRGLGALLAGRDPDFPLDSAVPRVRALARAFVRDETISVYEPARALLGLGVGLTPSGDDLVGAALFARRLVRPSDRRWRSLAARLSCDIRVRSHPVSAALFADIAVGRSFAPLHELAQALAAGADDAAFAAARRLIAIGHSSGWDMLTGFIIGTGVDLAANRNVLAVTQQDAIAL